MLLIVVNSHTKWFEVISPETETAATIVEVLWLLFSSFGLPRTLVLDNGSWN